MLTAQLARELLETDLIKLEVIGDAQTLHPDARETLAAAEAARQGRLHGAALHRRRSDRVQAARGDRLRRRHAARRADRQRAGRLQSVFDSHHQGARRRPVIVDAGVGTASDAAIAMELGVDALLMNTGIARLAIRC